jgi:hypothetical protein
MPLYPFEVQIAVDATNPNVVVQDNEVTFYDPADTALTSPLALLTPLGLPQPNPVQTSAAGFTPAFQASIPHIMWTDGTYSGYISSYKGMLDEAIAARNAAEAALINGMPAGGTAGQALAKTSGADYAATWTSLIVIIGPADPWPTGLADGTLVLRTAT